MKETVLFQKTEISKQSTGESKVIEAWNNPYVELQFLCRICQKPQLYKYRRNWRRHYESHSDEKQYVCDICGTGYKANYLLKNHIAKQHPKFEQPQTEPMALPPPKPPMKQEPETDEPFYLNL